MSSCTKSAGVAVENLSLRCSEYYEISEDAVKNFRVNVARRTSSWERRERRHEGGRARPFVQRFDPLCAASGVVPVTLLGAALLTDFWNTLHGTILFAPFFNDVPLHEAYEPSRSSLCRWDHSLFQFINDRFVGSEMLTRRMVNLTKLFLESLRVDAFVGDALGHSEVDVLCLVILAHEAFDEIEKMARVGRLR
jgi:hypothetical protein